MRRSLGVALWTLVGLVACVFGALSALVGTHRGRALLARAAEAGLKRVFSGSVEVGNVSGALLTGLTLSDVRLFDPDTTLVAWLPRAQLSYDPFDLVAGRVVLFKLTLRQPVINIVQHKTGRLNLEELLRLGGPDTGPHGPATLILFRNVQIPLGGVVALSATCALVGLFSGWVLRGNTAGANNNGGGGQGGTGRGGRGARSRSRAAGRTGGCGSGGSSTSTRASRRCRSRRHASPGFASTSPAWPWRAAIRTCGSWTWPAGCT